MGPEGHSQHFPRLGGREGAGATRFGPWCECGLVTQLVSQEEWEGASLSRGRSYSQQVKQTWHLSTLPVLTVGRAPAKVVGSYLGATVETGQLSAPAGQLWNRLGAQGPPHSLQVSAPLVRLFSLVLKGCQLNPTHQIASDNSEQMVLLAVLWASRLSGTESCSSSPHRPPFTSQSPRECVWSKAAAPL